LKFLKNIFKSDLVECPRCLGKGHVDWDDIQRLKKNLKWIPGDCAYCAGNGKVPKSMLSKVKVNETYLTKGLSLEERLLLIDNNPQALERAKGYDEFINSFITEVGSLSKSKNLSAEEITDSIIETEGREFSENQRIELLEYVKRIVEKV